MTWREVDETEALRLLLGEVPAAVPPEYRAVFVDALSRAFDGQPLRVAFENADVPRPTPDLLHAMVGRTRVWIDLGTWRTARGDAASAAVVYALTHSPLWAAAIAVARKVWGTVKVLSDDEVEIVARIAAASRGDLYGLGAAEKDLEANWPDDVTALHDKLDAMQDKGVLAKRRDRWTVT